MPDSRPMRSVDALEIAQGLKKLKDAETELLRLYAAEEISSDSPWEIYSTEASMQLRDAADSYREMLREHIVQVTGLNEGLLQL